MGRDNLCAAKLPVDPRSTSYKLHLLRIDFFPLFSSSSASVPHDKQKPNNKHVGGAQLCGQSLACHEEADA